MEENNYSEKSWLKTFCLCWLAGIFGAHRNYVGKKKTAWIQFFTLGGLGFWVLKDLYLIATQKFTDFNNKKIINKDRSILRIVGIACLILCVLNVSIIVNKIEDIKKVFNDNAIKITERIDVDANIEAFILESANNIEMQKLKLEIEKIEGVSSVKFKSKEQGFLEFTERFGDKAYLFEPYADTISNSYIITVNNVKKAEEICNVISNLENVKKANNGYESLKSVNRQKNIIIFEKTMINIVALHRILWILELAIIGLEILEKENKLRKNLEI